MNEAIIKNKLIEYAEQTLAPALVDEIEMCTSISDEEGQTNVWLLETDTGEEYWLLEGVYPSNIYKKAGIYMNAEKAYEAYKEMLEEAEQQEEIPDRFAQL